MHCKNLRKVRLPGRLSSIPSGAFSHTGIEEMELPVQLRTIGASAFQNCMELCRIKIPDTVKKIEKCAFYQCKKIEEVLLPDSLTQIEKSAFFNCESLKSITIPKSVREIGAFAFSAALIFLKYLLEIPCSNMIPVFSQIVVILF